jgi:hypothetical protein
MPPLLSLIFVHRFLSARLPRRHGGRAVLHTGSPLILLFFYGLPFYTIKL